MICGKTVDDIDICPQRILVLFRADNGSHFYTLRSNSLKVVRGEEEVVRCDLTCDLHASFLGSFDDQNLNQTQADC